MYEGGYYSRKGRTFTSEYSVRGGYYSWGNIIHSSKVQSPHGKMSRQVSAPGSVLIKTERMFRQSKFLEPIRF